MAIQPYPVDYAIARPERYNRWTVAFRLILAIPQLIIVGDRGLLVSVLGMLTFFAWIAILFTGRYPRSLRDFNLFIFRWTQNVDAYVQLQAAPYPPFGAGEYPLALEVRPGETYNRWAVAFRLILVIPQAIVLVFLLVAQAIVTLIAWFAILFTGQYPVSLFPFSVGVSRWKTRVLAYLLLFVDEYPPFALDTAPGTGPAQMQPV